MAKKKNASPPQAIDTTAGQTAYGLAVQYKTQIEPRLPAQTIAELAADLTTLGAPPPAQTQSTPATPAAPPPPPLADALAKAASLVSAFHEAVKSAKPGSSVLKDYGAGSRAAGKEVKEVLASAQKIVTQATAQPAGALALGILPADVTALEQAITDLTASEAAAHGASAKAGPTGSEKRAAEKRMREVVARIAGAGALAFALDPAVRAKFEALRAT